LTLIVLRLLADENFNGRILRALQRRLPDLDVIRAQDTPFSGVTDPELLEKAAEDNRILLTHDVATLVGFANDRLRTGRPVPGVIAVRTTAGIGPVIEDLVLLLLASEARGPAPTAGGLPISQDSVVNEHHSASPRLRPAWNGRRASCPDPFRVGLRSAALQSPALLQIRVFRADLARGTAEWRWPSRR
jgi:predicted nuclease of predicted toxin-antitoxin system